MPQDGVAIIGMAGRFPGAASVAAFWENVKSGVESITRFPDSQLAAGGIPQSLLDDPSYVKARAVLSDADHFDAAFFGISPKEAELMDPQHRLFLESSWEALERAGYDPETYAGPIGVYAGLSLNTYLLANLCADRATVEEIVRSHQVGNYHLLTGNDKDYLATRVSYKLNLTGPSVTVQTACSTSLVAICQACQSLQTYQCDMALAGGVSITFPQERGALYQEGGMVSRDGTCRPFDSEAQGTVFGSGVGVIVLKRLSDALADGDTIHAVIKGAALNNDGSGKASYTAPSVTGQADVIALAQALADVPAETVTYVETHGTATPLGDPIEIAGLTRAFRETTDKTGFCAIGSVKGNIGHLEAAAGVAGVIKTALALQDGVLPPSLHFDQPNPRIDFAQSPFFVNTKLTPWPQGATARRAGVSSFGVGGTNAHIVLEEPPRRLGSASARAWQIVPLSAKTETALGAASANLARHLRETPDTNLADAAWTLQTGRRAFAHRKVVICRDAQDAAQSLEDPKSNAVFARQTTGREPSVVFMFPGQGAQQVNMGRELYDAEPMYRAVVDECCELLLPALGLDLRDVLYPADADSETAARRLTETWLTQPALFVTEYALARLWMTWGIQPTAMIGHSLGEYVAACIAGVFSLPDALMALAERARMMQDLPGGSMLAVRLPDTEAAPYIAAPLSLAAMNSPSLCVVAGPTPEIQELQRKLEAQEIVCRPLKTSHAFHSEMVAPVVAPFIEVLSKIPMHPPAIPFISNLSGAWITDADATSPEYWARHLREAVRFSQGIRTLLQDEPSVLIEIGPGTTLATLARQHLMPGAETLVLASLETKALGSEQGALLSALGQVWLRGGAVDWAAFHAPQTRRRVPLPTYPFERKKYWVEPVASQPAASAPQEIIMPLQQHSPEIGEATAASVSSLEGPGATAVSMSRAALVMDSLQTQLYELSGVEKSQLDPDVSLLDLGFDSLFLTQASQSFQRAYGVKIPFRRLLEDLSTIRAVAAYLDETAAPDRLPKPVAEPVRRADPRMDPPVMLRLIEDATPLSSAPAALTPGVAAPQGEGLIERIMAQQFQIMAQQLEVLRGGGAAGNPALLNPPPVVPLAAATAPVPVKPNGHKANGHAPAAPVKAFGPFKPLETGPAGTLTERQQNHLDDLIARTVRKTPNSKRSTAENRRYLADPRAVAGFRPEWKEMVYPIVATHSLGSKLWDIDGNEFLDITMGFGVDLFGHSPQFVIDAVATQLATGIEIGPQSVLAGSVARKVCEMTGLDRATFCNTGSEAVMAALRAARTVTGRSKIVYFTGDYHGTFDEVLARTNIVGGAFRSVPAAPGIPGCMTEETLVLDYGTPETLETLRAIAGDVAAVLVEPVQSRRPDLQPKEFLQEVRRITADGGACLIFDEVITGFRVHPRGAQSWFGVDADLATYGKVIGGGMPIGVLAGKAEYMDAFDGGAWAYGDDSRPEVGVTFFAGTFIRHPLALAAADAVLDHLKDSGPALQERLNQTTAEFVGALNAWLTDANAPVRLAQFGSIFYPKFDPEWKWSSLLFFHLREKGIHAWEGRPCFLSTAHTDEDIARLMRAFQDTIAELQAGGFISGPELPAPSGPDGGARTEPRESYSVPLTEPQREVWLAAQMGPEASAALIESISINLDGAFEIEAMRAAVQTVVDRHEALRTTFEPTGMAQWIAASWPVSVPSTDLSALDPQARNAAYLEIVTREGCEPFDLVSGPLFRAQIVRLSEQSHVLVLSAHHLVCDGWSSGILIEEIGALYTAAVTGTPAALPAPLSFRDYARIQASPEAAEAAAQSEEYWRARLAGFTATAGLPADRPRPAVSGFQGYRRRKTLDSALIARIRRLSASEGCTLFTTLFASFALMVQRLSGQDDVVIGTPSAGQSQLENTRLVGHCVNFLPVRVQSTPDAAFRAFLHDVKGLVFDAYDHQDCTLGRLLSTMSLGRESAGRTPLIAATFNVDRLMSVPKFADLAWSIETNPRSFYQFDLGFNLVETGDAIIAECDYSAELFDDETIGLFLDGYEALLNGIAGAADQPLCALPLMPKTLQYAVSCGWARNDVDPPRPESVHALFEAQAHLTPDAVALDQQGRVLTYRELNERANRLAYHLRDLGIGPDSLVGVLLERSFDAVAGLLGILKAGGAYVPIDPSYPQERINVILSDAQPAVLLTHSRLIASAPRFAGTAICLDTDWADLGHLPTINLAHQADASSLAYVIYTSGSTGQPKGVAVPHRGIVRLVKGTDYLNLSSSQTFLQLASLAFDASTFEIWAPLLNGGRLVLMPPQSPSLAEIGDVIRERGVTTLWLTAGLFNAFVDHALDGLLPLTQLITGGDALSGAHCRKAVAALPGCMIVNGYGPTECTTFAVCHPIREADLSGATVPLGRPIRGTSAYVLDAHGQPVPPLVEGDLWLGGAGLAREYLNRPDLTAEKFVTHPDLAQRLYATGDRARWRRDGVLEFLGRQDAQVKIRGYRIEPAEIEQTLIAHPGVREAVVLARDFDGDKRLVAYVAAEPGARPSEDDLWQSVAARLPEFMHPAYYVFLESLPLTANGKPDRAKLPLPASPEEATCLETAEDVDVSEDDPLLRNLKALWRQVLAIEPHGIDENFFDCGGHSLLALRLFGLIEQRFGARLPFPMIFQAPTIRGLARAIRQEQMPDDDGPQLVPIQSKGSKPPLFCIHPDHGLVLFYRDLAHHLDSDQPVYGVQAAEIRGDGASPSVEEMASRYLTMIRARQPQGPYFLAGYSLGGVIAYEMAQQLTAAGQSVGLLGLLDTYAPVAFQENLIDKSPLQKMRGHLSLLKKMPLSERLDYLKQKTKEAISGKKDDWQIVAEDLAGALSPDQLEALQNAVVFHGQANTAYTPQPYSGKTVLFRAMDLDVFEAYDPTLWWREYCVGGLEIVDVPGSHWDMMKEPHIRRLAAALRACLDASVHVA